MGILWELLNIEISVFVQVANGFNLCSYCLPKTLKSYIRVKKLERGSKKKQFSKDKMFQNLSDFDFLKTCC